MQIYKAGKRILSRAIFKILSKINNQNDWENTFQIAVNQMNFGNGGNFSESGELFVAQYILNQTKQEPSITIFDVGANKGDYSKALSDIFQGKAKIYAFEPSVKTYELFVQTTKDLKNIIPNNLGFSDKEQSQLLFTNLDSSALASVYQRRLDHFGIEMNKTEEIKLSTIDSYCAANKIEKINFLKLDVEGHELNALRGAKEMMETGKIDFIQFEFGGCNIDSRTYFQDFYYLLKDHFNIYRILKDGLHELPTYKESYEVFITINYLAVRREVPKEHISGSTFG